MTQCPPLATDGRPRSVRIGSRRGTAWVTKACWGIVGARKQHRHRRRL